MIGCAFTLMRDPRAKVVIVTDGAKGADPKRPRLSRRSVARERKRESTEALGSLGIRDVSFLDLTEDAIRPLEVIRQLNRITRKGARVEAIYAHQVNDEHIDHRTVGVIGLVLAAEWDCPIWQYPVAPVHRNRKPDRRVTATRQEKQRKRDLLRTYRTQWHVTKDYVQAPEVFWRGL